MSPQEALSIIQSLADGIDPLTGEALSDPGPLNQPGVIRALFAAVQALENLTDAAAVVPARHESHEKKAENAGTPWSPEEDERLVNGYDAGVDVSELAMRHGRTKGAITSRFVRLGRIER